MPGLRARVHGSGAKPEILQPGLHEIVEKGDEMSEIDLNDYKSPEIKVGDQTIQVICRIDVDSLADERSSIGIRWRSNHGARGIREER